MINTRSLNDVIYALNNRNYNVELETDDNCIIIRIPLGKRLSRNILDKILEATEEVVI